MAIFLDMAKTRTTTFLFYFNIILSVALPCKRRFYVARIENLFLLATQHSKILFFSFAGSFSDFAIVILSVIHTCGYISVVLVFSFNKLFINWLKTNMRKICHLHNFNWCCGGCECCHLYMGQLQYFLQV